MAETIVSVNPATGETLGSYNGRDNREVGAAFSAARDASAKWRATGVRQRLAIIDEFQRLLLGRKQEVAETITREAGKPVVEALLTEVLVVLDSARFVRENAADILRPARVPHGSPPMKLKTGHLLHEPYGVIGIIAPWNYPFSIPATETLAALAMGNAVLLKPSELTTGVAMMLADLLHRAGVPMDIFQVLPGRGETGAALTASAIDKLVFTGSVATGKRIAQAAASRLMPILLELGGKDPMIVLSDADIDVASSGAIWGAFMNAGQTCLSVERCYVHSDVYERFVEACVEKTRRLRVGNGMDPEVEVGPMIHERQLRVVEQQIEDAIAKGARILAGGNRMPELGPNFYAPTVLANVDHTMTIMKEETFGPVLPIMAFDFEDEVVRLANDSDYGLAASIWTKDRCRGERLSRNIEAGTVMINDAVASFGISEAPHGGVKMSGKGRTHGRAGLEEMVRAKYVDSDLLPSVKKVWWYGYGGGFGRQMNEFAETLFSRSMLRRLRAAGGAAGSLGRKGKI